MGPKRNPEAGARRVADGPPPPQWQWPDWIVVSALGLLVVTTAILAAFTTSLHSRINALRKERTLLITPAVQASQDLAVVLALELDAIHQYAIQPDPVTLAEYREDAAARRLAVARLEPLTRQLGGAAERHSLNLRRLTTSWDSAAIDPRRLATLSPEERERRLAGVRVLYRAMIRETSAQQAALRAVLERTRAEFDYAELRIWYFTLGLAGLVLAASLLVLWLFRRSRWLGYVAERRRLQAEAAMEHRARLIRGITHDVKNPLSNADGSAQLLELALVGRLTQDQLDTVGRIRRGIRAALGIISALLDLSRAEAGKLEIQRSTTDVAAILDHAVADYRVEAEANGLALKRDVSADLPHVTTDGDRVTEVVGNLVSNALKYTPTGGSVTLGAAVRSDGLTPFEGRWLAVTVADTGPGVLPEETETIFEEFYRGRSLADRAPGVGLGLSVSRRIARLLGGDITVESETGKGAAFTLWLPFDHETSRRRAA